MSRSTTMRVRFALVAVVAGAGLLTSCGSSSDKASTSSTRAAGTPAPATATTTTPATPAAVTAKKSDKLGTILADGSAMTLYTLTANGKAVACTGPCLQAWPPATLPAGQSKATGSPGISGLGAMMGASGTQVTANGLPLYRFVKDQDGEDAYGEGIASFGGVWHVVKTTAAPQVAEKESTTTSTTPTTSSSGY